MRANTGQFPRRPPRLTVLFQDTRPFYFVTFNAYRRQTILADDVVHDTFCLFCTRALEHGVAVGRYVIMPDHIHLFAVVQPESTTLSQWIKSLKSVVGKTLLRQDIRKPHWQEGFFDHVMRNSESYAEKWEYVRQNPVRAGLVSRPEDWPYAGEINELFF